MSEMEPGPEPALTEAVFAGDLERIQALLDAGADVRYVRPSGYTVMIDAMHGRDILKDPNLLAILRLLISRGADLDAESDYGESALSVASWAGRFDAVKLLLDAGANPEPLGWTPLHRAVALGTADDVKVRLDSGDDLSARDRWDRAPLLLALQVGDVEKAELLLGAGASVADRGRCGRSALVYPILGDDAETLRWLLERGADPNATDDFGGFPLFEAAAAGASRCVRALLDAGVDPNRAREFKIPASALDDPELAALAADWENDEVSGESPMKAAATVEIARMLAAAGGDFAEINDEARDELIGRVRTESIECSPADYQVAKHRVFGDANPQLMNLPFWRAMVAFGGTAYAARQQFGDDPLEAGAVWCHSRFGRSFTELLDGRVIEIGGEHEDYYDPDFCIYNDVIVHQGDGRFDIYGYPREVFPPTDFHSATLFGDHIHIIGSLGYVDERRFGVTPVYRLNIHTLKIEPMETEGEAPGWIYEHRARLVGSTIEITGGKICDLVDGEEDHEPNLGKYALDLDAMVWSKLS